MMRSKSRFGSGTSHQSVFSRTFSASKICRRDTTLLSQIDSNALKSVDRDDPIKIHRSSTSLRRLPSIVKMEEEEGERRPEAVGERGDGNEQKEEGARQLSPKKIEEMRAELNAMKQSIEASEREMRLKEDDIQSMKTDLHKAKVEFEMILTERNNELNRFKESEACSKNLISEKEITTKNLTDELEKVKLSEAKTMETFVFQMKLLEQTKMELEDSRYEIASLTEKLERNSPNERSIINNESKRINYDDIVSMRQSIESLQIELQQAKDEETAALEKAHQIHSLRNELKSAIDAEERSNKAMDDLAMALKEVATESNQIKEKLSLTGLQLEQVKADAAQFKELLRNSDNRYKKLLDDSKKESDFQNNVIGRLRLEAEESHLAWNDKEMGFVDCIKNVEDEKSLLQEEITRLAESLKVSETTIKTLREENHKLRDILKQGLKEANVAKEEAVIAKEEAIIAKEESSMLKECLAEKNESLDIITLENEQLRISEAAAKENIKELKQLLSSSSSNSSSTAAAAALPKKPPEEEKSSGNSEDDQNGKKRMKTFSFDVTELKRATSEFGDDDFMECEKVFGVAEEDDPARAEALKGSIFDTELDSPNSPHTPVHRRMSAQFMDTAEGDMHSDQETEPLESDHDTDASDGRHSPRKRRALLQRFTDLIRMRKGSSGGGGSGGGSAGISSGGSAHSHSQSHKKEVLAE